jgi:serine/threonine protein kinase
MHTPALVPGVGTTALPLGTKVGPWRVTGFRGRGIYGTVYSAEPVGRGKRGPMALKLAIYPADPRFEREAELLARIRHPSVPRLLDSGLWRHPLGPVHPYVVMDWVEGVPLYDWAAWRNPSSRQVLALLAQAVGALQATHEVSGVHRDVKGGNMLVRLSDGRLFLTDFGTGYFTGASRLTPLNVQPGTPAYLSPELWRDEALSSASPSPARPADDVFALGVTAYRLVTDAYPPFTDPRTKEGRCWLPGGGGAPPPKLLNPRVDAQLNALILRMLSVRPEDRGAAGELAEAMERGVAHARSSADEPMFEWETRKPSEWTEAERAEAAQLGHRPRRRSRERAREAEQADSAARSRASPLNQRMGPRKWLPWVAALVSLGLWPGETGFVRIEEEPTLVRSRKAGEAISLGDTAQGPSTAAEKAPSKAVLALELPEQPLPGQLKPDAKGRCPKEKVAINGGCWAKVHFDSEGCDGVGFMYQGACYVPARAPVRQPTSAPRKNEP